METSSRRVGRHHTHMAKQILLPAAQESISTTATSLRAARPDFRRARPQSCKIEILERRLWPASGAGAARWPPHSAGLSIAPKVASDCTRILGWAHRGGRVHIQTAAPPASASAPRARFARMECSPSAQNRVQNSNPVSDLLSGACAEPDARQSLNWRHHERAGHAEVRRARRPCAQDGQDSQKRAAQVQQHVSLRAAA